MRDRRRSARGALLAAGTVLGTAVSGVLLATPAEAAPVIRFDGHVLSITGDATRNAFVIGTSADGLVTLNGAPVLNGTVRRTDLTLVRMDGAGADDILRLDESRGAMPRGEFAGGEGNDTLDGGSAGDRLAGGAGIDTINGNGGADELIGDAGNDKAVGGPGADTVRLGADSDQFTWNLGDGNDRLDGDAGIDTLLFNGPEPDISAGVLPRVRIGQFVPPFDAMDVGGVEQVKLIGTPGPDRVNVGDLTGSGVAQVRVILDQPGNDTVGVLLGNGPARVRATGSATAGITISGMAVPVLISRATQLSIAGGPGDDVIDASALAPGTLTELVLDGNGTPQDPTNRTERNTLIGGPEGDVISSGSLGSGDRIEGRGGDDLLTGGPGDDQIFGGDGDDTLRGLGGQDVLDGGPGTNVIIP